MEYLYILIQGLYERISIILKFQKPQKNLFLGRLVRVAMFKKPKNKV